MSFSIRRYLGLDGSRGEIQYTPDPNNPISPVLLDRIDTDINELIDQITGSKPKPSNIEKPVTKEDFKDTLADIIKNSNLGNFYGPNDPRLDKLAEIASELLKDPNYTINDSQTLKKVVKLCLYDIVLYCDDSLSMTQEDRINTQVTFAERFARVILPLEEGSISLRFINASGSAAWDKMTDANAIANAVRTVPYTGYTPIGTNLKSKILDTLWYPKIAQGRDGLEKPLLVLVVTDGWPYGESDDLFRNVVLESIQRTNQALPGNNGQTLMFQLNQIGHEDRATNFIQGLHNDQALKTNLYCTSEKLDDKIAELKSNLQALDQWIVDLVSVDLDDE